MKTILTLLLTLISTITYAQEIDTLSFYSEAFKAERTVYIHKPENFKYQSEAVKLPVIYLLDGQHEWFINPLLSDIEYLQYTYEIPSAILVVIPHKDRYEECNVTDLDAELPLDLFITEELDQKLKKYNPNDFKMIIGHSFSASFSLYSYYRHPDYYSSVIAHTPLDEMDLLVKSFHENTEIDKNKISISIGGMGRGKDHFHRKKFDQLKEAYPEFFESIHVFEADHTTHNAVPIVATPSLLTKTFETFRERYSKIAEVDMEYKLVETPESAGKEMQKIISASKIGKHFYPPEIADINGIASRYWNNNFEEQVIMVYEVGTEYYPKYYDFYLSLYDLTLEKDEAKAKEYLETAEMLLTTVEDNWEGKNEVLEGIKSERLKNGW